MLPDDAEFSAGLDLALLGTVLLIVVGFARAVAGAGGGTPRLLRVSEDQTGGVASRPVAPEAGLLEPAAGAVTSPAALPAADPLWPALTLLALSVALVGPLWYWVGRPLYYRR
jgi:hypothetical protein